MFRKTGTKPADTENFSNFPRMINSVKISAVFRESGRGLWKVSLRSKGDVNVAKIAEMYKGGGHKNAAGFRIKADLKTAKQALLKASKKIK
jgi:phosphoesterase RecJ-like protein